jgi:hypothetical protein
VGPVVGVGALEGALLAGAELATLNNKKRAVLKLVSTHYFEKGLTTRADLSCDSHFLQNQGPVGTETMP